jgi:hypothetical protein
MVQACRAAKTFLGSVEHSGHRIPLHKLIARDGPPVDLENGGALHPRMSAQNKTGK